MMFQKIEWTGRQAIDPDRDGARVERVLVDGKALRVVVSGEALEDGITEGQVRAIAEAKIASCGDALPAEIRVTTGDLRAA